MFRVWEIYPCSSMAFPVFETSELEAMSAFPYMYCTFCQSPWPDSKINKTSWNEQLGRCDFTLAFILLLNFQSSSEDQTRHSFRRLPDPSGFISSVREFTSWIIWGKTGEESSSFFSHLTDLAVILLRHGQCDAVEVCGYSLISPNNTPSLSNW